MAPERDEIAESGSADAMPPVDTGLEEAIPEAGRDRQGRSTFKRNCLLAILLLFLLGGVLDGFAPPQRLPLPLIGIPVSVAALCWCIRDAKEHGDRIRYPLRGLIFILVPAGVGVYLLSRRRIGSLLKAVGFSIIVTLAGGVAYMITYRLYWGGWPDT